VPKPDISLFSHLKPAESLTHRFWAQMSTNTNGFASSSANLRSLHYVSIQSVRSARRDSSNARRGREFDAHIHDAIDCTQKGTRVVCCGYGQGWSRSLGRRSWLRILFRNNKGAKKRAAVRPVRQKRKREQKTFVVGETVTACAGDMYMTDEDWPKDKIRMAKGGGTRSASG
jgi:hypothetical protein